MLNRSICGEWGDGSAWQDGVDLSASTWDLSSWLLNERLKHPNRRMGESHLDLWLHATCQISCAPLISSSQKPVLDTAEALNAHLPIICIPNCRCDGMAMSLFVVDEGAVYGHLPQEVVKILTR
jgi:hypothetical protein